MKNKFRIFSAFIALTFFLAINTLSVAQPPPPPPPPSSGHGSGGNSPAGAGAGAPVGEGVFLLLGLAGLYGGKKIFNLRMQLKSK